MEMSVTTSCNSISRSRSRRSAMSSSRRGTSSVISDLDPRTLAKVIQKAIPQAEVTHKIYHFILHTKTTGAKFLKITDENLKRVFALGDPQLFHQLNSLRHQPQQFYEDIFNRLNTSMPCTPQFPVEILEITAPHVNNHETLLENVQSPTAVLNSNVGGEVVLQTTLLTLQANSLGLNVINAYVSHEGFEAPGVDAMENIIEETTNEDADQAVHQTQDDIQSPSSIHPDQSDQSAPDRNAEAAASPTHDQPDVPHDTSMTDDVKPIADLDLEDTAALSSSSPSPSEHPTTSESQDDSTPQDSLVVEDHATSMPSPPQPVDPGSPIEMEATSPSIVQEDLNSSDDTDQAVDDDAGDLPKGLTLEMTPRHAHLDERSPNGHIYPEALANEAASHDSGSDISDEGDNADHAPSEKGQSPFAVLQVEDPLDDTKLTPSETAQNPFAILQVEELSDDSDDDAAEAIDSTTQEDAGDPDDLHGSKWIAPNVASSTDDSKGDYGSYAQELESSMFVGDKELVEDNGGTDSTQESDVSDSDILVRDPPDPHVQPPAITSSLFNEPHGDSSANHDSKLSASSQEFHDEPTLVNPEAFDNVKSADDLLDDIGDPMPHSPVLKPSPWSPPQPIHVLFPANGLHVGTSSNITQILRSPVSDAEHTESPGPIQGHIDGSATSLQSVSARGGSQFFSDDTEQVADSLFANDFSVEMEDPSNLTLPYGHSPAMSSSYSTLATDAFSPMLRLTDPISPEQTFCRHPDVDSTLVAFVTFVEDNDTFMTSTPLRIPGGFLPDAYGLGKLTPNTTFPSSSQPDTMEPIAESGERSDDRQTGAGVPRQASASVPITEASDICPENQLGLSVTVMPGNEPVAPTDSDIENDHVDAIAVESTLTSNARPTLSLNQIPPLTITSFLEEISPSLERIFSGLPLTPDDTDTPSDFTSPEKSFSRNPRTLWPTSDLISESTVMYEQARRKKAIESPIFYVETGVQTNLESHEIHETSSWSASVLLSPLSPRVTSFPFNIFKNLLSGRNDAHSNGESQARPGLTVTNGGIQPNAQGPTSALAQQDDNDT